jgi:hypothetical protein
MGSCAIAAMETRRMAVVSRCVGFMVKALYLFSHSHKITHRGYLHLELLTSCRNYACHRNKKRYYPCRLLHFTMCLARMVSPYSGSF